MSIRRTRLLSRNKPENEFQLHIIIEAEVVSYAK